QGVDVMPLLVALHQRPDLWDQNRLRTTHELTPHKQVSDIWLRFNDLNKYEQTGDPSSVIDEHESICYPAFHALPQARQMIMNLMARVEGIRLGRCLITRLMPGRKIDPHVDGGEHAAYYERFHVVLQGNPGSIFRCGDETVQMLTGEVWWFDNSVEHEVINNSAEERLHLIVDIRTIK
uniref:aspartyl/asparaginyl beta-hydroxylase domain-containing protein n=1 Tax=Cupriavidus basilensis TaxID=68895 RepID=UPI0007C7C828